MFGDFFDGDIDPVELEKLVDQFTVFRIHPGYQGRINIFQFRERWQTTDQENKIGQKKNGQNNEGGLNAVEFYPFPQVIFDWFVQSIPSLIFDL